MADRSVYATGKDRNGDITALCNQGASWSPRSKTAAIRDIETNTHTYYVPWNDGTTTRIRVVNDPTVSGGKYLRTDWDNTQRNNLDDLDDC